MWRTTAARVGSVQHHTHTTTSSLTRFPFFIASAAAQTTTTTPLPSTLFAAQQSVRWIGMSEAAHVTIINPNKKQPLTPEQRLEKKFRNDRQFQRMLLRKEKTRVRKGEALRQNLEDDVIFERRSKVFAARINKPWEIIAPALIHPSWNPQNNHAQLEFLGDKVLNLLVAEMLSLRYPNAPVWALTEAYQHYISNTHLARVGDSLGIDQALRWRPETPIEATVDKEPQPGPLAVPKVHIPSAYSDAIEAIVASIYRNEGLKAARAFIEQHIITEPDADAGGVPSIGKLLYAKRPKAALQDILSRRREGLPFYKVLQETGRASHRSMFVVGVYSDDRQLATGTGRSISLAETDAAHEALKKVWGAKSYEIQPSQKEEAALA